MNTTEQEPDTIAAKTLSLKSIGIDIPQGGGDFLNKVVCLISGKAVRYTPVSNQFGVSYRLFGSFFYVNALTGQVFDAEEAFMPSGDFAQSIVTALEGTDGNVSIGEDHPLEVICAPSTRSARGYTFILRKASTPEIVESKSKMAKAMLGTLSTMAALPKPNAAVKEVENKK